ARCSWQGAQHSTWVSTLSRSGPLSRSPRSALSTSGEGHLLRSAAMRSPPRRARGSPQGRGAVEGLRPPPAIGIAPGRPLLIGPIRYNHRPDTLQPVRRRQVEGEPVALSLRHVEEEGVGLDPERRELHAVLVKQGCLIAKLDLGAEAPLVLQHPDHLVPL